MADDKKIITDGYYPLRPFQRWVIDSNFEKAKSTMMNIGALIKLDSSVDLDRLADAVNFVTNRYDVFRCRLTVHPETSDICQRFDGEVQKVAVEKISDEDFKNRISKLRVPYHLIDAPLFRIYLFETPTAKYIYVDFYHAIIDGTAVVILFLREVDMVYKGKIIKKTPQSYAEYIEEEMNIPPRELMEGRKFFVGMLKHFDDRKHLLPADLNTGKKFAKDDFEFPIKNISREFFKKKSFGAETFFITAAMLAIAKTVGVDESLISRIYNGRATSKEMRLMGTMIEELPIYCEFKKFSTVGELLQNVETEINLGVKYRKSLDVVYKYGLEDETITFIYQKGGGMSQHGVLNLCGTEAEILELPDNEFSVVENSLDIELIEWDDVGEDFSYLLMLDYNASRYSENFMKKFAETFNEIVLNLQDENKSVAEILRG